MLRFVREALVKAGAVSPQARLIHNVRLTTESTLRLDVGDGTGSWFHVKACRERSLAEEFDRFRLARERFPAYTAEPIAHTCLAGWSILIARAVEHVPVGVSDLASPGSSGASLRRQLIGFLAAAQASAKADILRQDNETFMREAVACLATSPAVSPPLRDLALSLDPTVWGDIPAISQHGNLVLNNLARAGDRLLIFDWKDYGVTALAGLDICLFALSMAGMDAAGAAAIQRKENPAGQLWAFAREACATSELPYDTFRALVPVYLLAFRYLKRNCSEEIRARLDTMLGELLT
ncbi:MAG: hypothetical protein RKP46_04835 [Candidatus Accumulibacter sp.]|uniref:hypothetical protein n=1 Tax=Accumulibacter sp. TaxID=2053492 RepID=UPI0028787FB8|nr:hypothetical protein [Accumulibacter sp.]MDS4013666.1 hypothetical protein [Accumulibacter sp.]